MLRLIHSFDPDLAGQISTFEKLRLSRNWDHLSAGSLKNIQLSTTSNASQDAKFIKQLPIPRYSSEPKDFGDSVDDGIFVWQHRLDLVNSIIDAVDMGTKIETDEFGAPPIDFKILPEQQRGMILSGPHGIGKSGMTRFIAAVAQMNDCFLFYVVREVDSGDRSFGLIFPVSYQRSCSSSSPMLANCFNLQARHCNLTSNLPLLRSCASITRNCVIIPIQ